MIHFYHEFWVSLEDFIDIRKGLWRSEDFNPPTHVSEAEENRPMISRINKTLPSTEGLKNLHTKQHHFIHPLLSLRPASHSYFPGAHTSTSGSASGSRDLWYPSRIVSSHSLVASESSAGEEGVVGLVGSDAMPPLQRHEP